MLTKLEQRRATKLAEIKKIVEARGWTLCTQVYGGYKSKLDLLCPNGHPVSRLASGVKNKCLDCPSEASLKAAAKFYQIISEKGGTSLEEYIDAHTKVKVKCKFGHIWPVTPNGIISSGSWCPVCSENSPEAAAEKYYTTIAEKGGTALEEYIDCETHRKIKCRLGHIWSPRPANVTSQGTWCPICMQCSQEDAARRFGQLVVDKGGTLLEEYIDNSTPRKIQCDEGHIWNGTPYNMMGRGDWCPVCSEKCPKAAEAKFRAIVAEKGGKVHGQYVNAKTPIRTECDKGHIWLPYSSGISSGKWCPVCVENCPKAAAAKFYRIISEKKGVALEPYINNHTRRKIQCEFKHTWSPLPTNITSVGSWCPVCVDHSPEAAKDKFLQAIKIRNGTLLEEYIDTNTKVRVQCEEGHIWPVRPHSVTSSKSWCPVCNQSHGEVLVKKFLRELLPSIHWSFQKELDKYKCDFHVSYGSEVYIEFDGEQHFRRVTHFHKDEKSFEVARQRDITKTKIVVEQLKHRMIRLTYNVLKCDENTVKELFIQALQMSIPLLYIDAENNQPFISTKAEIYSWLTEQVVLPKISRLKIVKSEALPLPSETLPLPSNSQVIKQEPVKKSRLNIVRESKV